MTITLDAPTQLPRSQSLIPVDSRPANLRRMGQRYADTHDLPTVLVKRTTGVVTLRGFATAEQARDYRNDKGGQVGIRSASLYLPTPREITPTVGMAARLHDHHGAQDATVTAVRENGMSVRPVAGGKAIPVKRTGPGRYSRGSVVVTL